MFYNKLKDQDSQEDSQDQDSQDQDGQDQDSQDQDGQDQDSQDQDSQDQKKRRNKKIRKTKIKSKIVFLGFVCFRWFFFVFLRGPSLSVAYLLTGLFAISGCSGEASGTCFGQFPKQLGCKGSS